MGTRGNSSKVNLGEETALSTEKRKGPPDKREVSVRWLSGTVLTAVTSITLMGGALFAALESQQVVDQTGEINTALQEDADAERETNAEFGKKADPILPIAPQWSEKQILRISTMTRTDSGNKVAQRPFARLATSLAQEPNNSYEIPGFDPIKIFASSQQFREKGSDEVIYTSNIEGEIKLNVVNFPLYEQRDDALAGLSDSEIEKTVRSAVPILLSTEKPDLTPSLVASAYIDPVRFETGPDLINDPFATLGVTIVEENVSNIAKSESTSQYYESNRERIVAIRSPQGIRNALTNEVTEPETLAKLGNALESQLGELSLNPDHQLRFTYPPESQQIIGAISKPEKVSVYENDTHMVTVARLDSGEYKLATPPEEEPVELGPQRPQISTSALPSIYTGIYRAGLKHGLPDTLIHEMVRIYSFELDFKTRVRTSDEIDIFYSLNSDTERADENSEILYTAINQGGLKRKYYRFKTSDDGVVDYYDEFGKSAKKFLMRKPITNAKFRSPFGWRRHPILRVSRLHKGVDWSARRGTPILAAGNGVIEEAKWASGYGRWIKIRHANGYTTSYAHQSRFAAGIAKGVRVRQGQVIGYVGSTGLSTGPHLHYEVTVNGRHVDPMRIRLPRGRVLDGAQLAEFEKERNRIDQLLAETDRDAFDQVASR